MRVDWGSGETWRSDAAGIYRRLTRKVGAACALPDAESAAADAIIGSGAHPWLYVVAVTMFMNMYPVSSFQCILQYHERWGPTVSE